jgi:hypothetical protein
MVCCRSPRLVVVHRTSRRRTYENPSNRSCGCRRPGSSCREIVFLDLGLEVLGEREVEGEWLVDRVIGLENVKNAAVMLGVPGGQATIELIQFFTPSEVFDNFLPTPWVSGTSQSSSRISKLWLPG